MATNYLSVVVVIIIVAFISSCSRPGMGSEHDGRNQYYILVAPQEPGVKRARIYTKNGKELSLHTVIKINGANVK
jgi:hypothetical protein